MSVANIDCVWWVGLYYTEYTQTLWHRSSEPDVVHSRLNLRRSTLTWLNQIIMFSGAIQWWKNVTPICIASIIISEKCLETGLVYFLLTPNEYSDPSNWWSSNTPLKSLEFLLFIHFLLNRPSPIYSWIHECLINIFHWKGYLLSI